MLIRTAVAAFALLASFSPAFSQGCHQGRQAQISCADGLNWDSAAQKCVTVGS